MEATAVDAAASLTNHGTAAARYPASGIAGLLGGSDLMCQLRETLRQLLVAESALQDSMNGVLPPPLLLTGEPGSGKKAVALALHQDGPRRAAPFRVLRCAGLTPARFEEACRVATLDLPTTPLSTSPGPLSSLGDLAPLSHGATLVFDEVSELIPELQTRLLARLAAWSAPGIGRSKAPAVRVIATTQRSLETLAQAGHFRADLCFRLGVIQLSMPPLRARPEDVEPLAEHFITELVPRFGRHRPALARSAVRRLAAHPWLGNVRELRLAVESALLTNHAPMLTGALFNLPDPATARPGGAWGALAGAMVNPVTGPISHPLTSLPAASGSAPPLREFALGIETLQPLRPTEPTRDLAELAAVLASASVTSYRRRPSEVERAALVSALELCRWNVCRTAQSLNLTRDALRYRIQKHGLRRTGYDRTNKHRESSEHVAMPRPSHPDAFTA